MKYDEFFEEPQKFSDGSYIFHGDLTIEKVIQQAREMFDLGEKNLIPENFERTLVRFGFAPDYVESREDFDGPIWYTGAKPGKGAKEVWRFRC